MRETEMRGKVLRFSVFTALVVMFFLLPARVKDKGGTALVGPDLSEVDYSEIFFQTNIENLQLSGMLFVPKGEGPFPTIVIIHGSGTSRRNNVWYLSVAHHLQQNGIAVLLPDKRGSEKSAGKWLGASFEQLAADILPQGYKNCTYPGILTGRNLLPAGNISVHHQEIENIFR